MTFSMHPPSVQLGPARFTYPSHVIAPTMDQAELYDAFMPKRVQAFLDGINVNIMAYGQTGSGKTHTVFGPPGIMARAAGGANADPNWCVCTRLVYLGPAAVLGDDR